MGVAEQKAAGEKIAKALKDLVSAEPDAEEKKKMETDIRGRIFQSTMMRGEYTDVSKHGAAIKALVQEAENTGPLSVSILRREFPEPMGGRRRRRAPTKKAAKKSRKASKKTRRR